MSELLLGVDVGSSRIKAVMIDRGGREVAEAAGATPFVTSDDGRVEMEVDAFLRRLGDVLAGLGNERGRVVGVGVAGIAESGAPLDAGRRALAPVIAWHDGRGAEQVALLEGRFGPDLPRRTGDAVRAVSTAVKLGWLVDHGLRGAERWLGVPELVLHALAGAEATEESLAARTGCYDVAARHWMREVAEALGFSVDIFPEVRSAGDAMGAVTAAGGMWSGLPAGIPVTVAGHDHLAGMGGAGVRAGEVANSVGTAETLVARCADVPDIEGALGRRVAVKLYPGGREWVALVSAARAGLVLESAAAALGRSLQELDRLAAGAAPVEVDLEADPRPDAEPGRVWAGVLAALTARTADAFERLVAVVGSVERMVVFGGGSVSEPWLAAKAAALPVPVVRSPVASAVARGAALHAGVAAGWWPSVDAAPAPA